MLKNLHISNYALINALDISFEGGFSIITGETGAGKSILLGALSLILGQRADSSVLKDSTQNCVVEANFDISQYQLESYFEQHELDYNTQLVIRRVINSAGKSRTFINDLPATLNVLKDLSNLLIDIHSQHNNLLIHDDNFQLDVVDSYAKSHKLLTEYRYKYKSYKQTLKAYKDLKENAKNAEQELAYTRHKHQEIETAALHEGEDQELEQELNTLSHAEEIKTNLLQASFLLSGNEENITVMLKNCINKVEQIAEYLPHDNQIVERLNSTYIELSDIASDIDIRANDAEFDPERATWVNDRLNLIYGLQKKYNLHTAKQLMELQTELAKKIQFIESLDFEIETLEKQLTLQQQETEKIAAQLTKHRETYIPKIEDKIIKTLQELGMPKVRFKIERIPLPDFSNNGKDLLRFTFSANQNMPLQDISKVASGGEVSRLMLSIKWLLSHSKALPTIIFDEIDTGISGDIADKMGSIMQDMAKSMQVISITHLPQIAEKRTVRYKVFKEDENGDTNTLVKKLNAEERILEIAKMLSGRELTAAALENARILLGN